MKVYVVTSGCYSDYQIEAVFTDPDKARAYANLDSDRQVEEYEADSVAIAEAEVNARIWYDPEKNEITCFDTGGHLQGRCRPEPDKYEYHTLCAYRRLSKRTLEDVKKNGKKSPILLKSMQDAWARYKDEHWIELGKKEKSYGVTADNYGVAFARSSIVTMPDKVADNIVKVLWKDGVQIPTSKDMQELQRELIKKTAEENIRFDEQDELH